jgi:uncharacterized membrane protein HdeD (DUF308 family)
MNTTLLHLLARNWSFILLRGIVAILFGIMALAWPGITILVLVMLFGASAAIDGVLALIVGIKGGTPVPRWWLIVVGLIGILAGIATMTMPGITALVLIMIIGGWAVARGIFEIIGAIQIRKEIDDEWFLILHGAISVLFGLYVLIFPGAGAIALIWAIAIYAIFIGLMMVAFSLRLRKHAKAATPAAA